YRLTLGDLAPLEPLLGVPLQASGGLSGDVQGPLQALRARATLQLDGWRVADLRGQRLQATLTAAQLPSATQATLKAQLVNVQGPSLASSSLNVEGTYAPQQGTFSVDVTGGPYQRSRLAGKVVLAQGQRLTLQTLRLQYQDLAWENAAPIEIRHSPQGVIEIPSLQLRSDSQTIRVQGTFDPHGAIQGEVQVQRLRLQPTVRTFAPHADVPNGRLNLALSLRGTLQQPQPHGTLDLRAWRWQGPAFAGRPATMPPSSTTADGDQPWRAPRSELADTR